MDDLQLTSVFARLRTALRHKALAILGSEDDADDALQEAFCRLWSRREAITDEGHASGLSHAAVRSASIDSIRRRASHPGVSLSAADVNIAGPDDTACDDTYGEVEAVIAGCLSDRDRDILRKREMYGYDYEELAAEYDLTAEAVRAVVSRARRTIRDKYLERKKTNKQPCTIYII